MKRYERVEYSDAISRFSRKTEERSTISREVTLRNVAYLVTALSSCLRISIYDSTHQGGDEARIRPATPLVCSSADGEKRLIFLIVGAQYTLQGIYEDKNLWPEIGQRGG